MSVLIPFHIEERKQRLDLVRASAITDYMKALPASVAKWMPSNFTVLGTDGFGLSESREQLRDHFEISADHIVHAALASLYELDNADSELILKQMSELNINCDKIDPSAR